MKILQALQTSDGAWRVEIVQHGPRVSYRLLHDQDEVGPLTIGTLELALRDAGVDMAELVEVATTTATARTR